VGKWDRLKTLKAHRGGVHAISVHRTGLVAMSAGADAHIAMWDMKKGRVAHKTKMKVKPELLAFTPSGSAYATVAGSRLTITSAESGAMMGVFDAPARVMCMAQSGNDNLALLGLEGGNIVGYDTRAAPHMPALTITKAHPTRVKGLVVPVDDAEAGCATGGPAGGPAMLVSASSEGIVRLWDLRTAGRGGAAAQAQAMGVTTARDDPVAEVKGGGRFTCMATMPSALPSSIAEAVLTERATRDPAEMAARRKQDKARKLEKAREKAATRQVQVQVPTPKQKQQSGDAKKESKSQAQGQGGQKQGQGGGKGQGGARGQAGGKGQGPVPYDDDFEVVAADDPAPSTRKSKNTSEGAAGGAGKRRKVSEPESIGAGVGSDEPLVQRKLGAKAGKAAGGRGKGGAAGGRSYEEVATAARRKGSGAKNPKTSKAFSKPARG